MLRSTILSLSVAGFVSAAPVTMTIGDSAGAVLRTDGLFRADLAIEPAGPLRCRIPGAPERRVQLLHFPDGSLSNEYTTGAGLGATIPRESGFLPIPPGPRGSSGNALPRHVEGELGL